MSTVVLALAALLMIAAPPAARAAEPLILYAAGSLRAPLAELAEAYARSYGTEVETEFAASGLLRERIEGGLRPDVFASANMEHPGRLMTAGLGGPVVMFARNRLCALARPELEVAPETLLETMLREDVRLGTSTPRADPSGDYAWELFAKADGVRPGSRERLEAKALTLTGGPDSPRAPEGRNTYGWVMAERRADLFLTYCTNARLARAEVPELRVVRLPEPLAVGADYGLIVLRPDRPEAWRLAAFILSPEGQGGLRDYGFTAVGVPSEG